MVFQLIDAKLMSKTDQDRLEDFADVYDLDVELDTVAGVDQTVNAGAPVTLNGTGSDPDNGVASWYDFAVAIQEEALARGLLERAVAVEPIRTEDYPTPARRPAYSVLGSERRGPLGLPDLPAWEESLPAVVEGLRR